MERRRVRDRVQPVERVRKVDETALGLDRGDRVREGHATRDLLGEEEPDHLALPVGLDLLAGDHDQVPRSRASSTASSAPPKTLWSVTAIAPRPAPPRGRAGLRPRPSSRPTTRCAGGGRRGSSPGRRAALGGTDCCKSLAAARRGSRTAPRARRATSCEGLALDAAPRLLRELRAERLVLGQPRQRRRGELGLLLDSRWRRDRGAGRRRLERDARQARRAPGRRSRPRPGSAARLSTVPGRSHACAAAQPRRDRRPSGQLTSSAGRRAPSPAARGGRADAASGRGRSTGRHSRTTSCRFFAGVEELRVDSFRDDPVGSPGKRCAAACAASGERRRARRYASEQPLALRSSPAGTRAAPARRSSQRSVRGHPGARGTRGSAGRARSRGRRRIRRGQSAVDRFARTPTGRPDSASPRDRHGRADRDQRRLRSVVQRAPARGEVGGPVRGREHGHRVAARAERVGDSRHVFVDVVRLRPRKRRDEADAKGHDHRV